TEARQGVSFDDMMSLQQKVAAVVREDPNVVASMSTVAMPNNSRIFFRLKDKKDRARVCDPLSLLPFIKTCHNMSAQDVIQEIRPRIQQIPGIPAYLQIPPTIRIGGNLTKSQYQYTLQTPDTKQLYEAEPKLEEALRALPQLQDVTSDLQIKNPQLSVQV